MRHQLFRVRVPYVLPGEKDTMMDILYVTLIWEKKHITKISLSPKQTS